MSNIIAGMPSEYVATDAFKTSHDVWNGFVPTIHNIFHTMRDLFNHRQKLLLTEELNAIASSCPLAHLPPLAPEQIFCRPDGFLYQEGYKVIEMNAGPSLGGLQATDAVQKHFRATFHGNYEFGQLIETLKRYLQSFNLAEHPIVSHRLLGGWPRYEDQNRELAIEIKRAGLNYQFMDSTDLLRQLLGGALSPSIILRRHEPDEPFDAVDTVLRQIETVAESRNIPVLCARNKTDIFDSKVFLAFASEYTEHQNIVYSRWIGNRDTAHLTKFKNRIETVLQERTRLVMKRDFSCQGLQVVFGDEVESDSVWTKLVNQAIFDGNWIFQRVEQGHPLTPIQMQSNGHTQSQIAVVSPFIFGSALGGIAIRLRLNEKKKTVVMPNNSATTVSVLGHEREKTAT